MCGSLNCVNYSVGLFFFLERVLRSEWSHFFSLGMKEQGSTLCIWHPQDLVVMATGMGKRGFPDTEGLKVNIRMRICETQVVRGKSK